LLLLLKRPGLFFNFRRSAHVFIPVVITWVVLTYIKGWFYDLEIVNG
jgi:hypothetical protein